MTIKTRQVTALEVATDKELWDDAVDFEGLNPEMFDEMTLEERIDTIEMIFGNDTLIDVSEEIWKNQPISY